MSGSSEVTSEQSSSVREGASYDEVYASSRGSDEGSTWSLEREPSAHSPNDEEEGDYKADGGKDEKEVKEGEKREDNEEENDEGSHEKSDKSID